MAKQLSSFPLSSVRLLDSPFKNAQDVDIRYVLSLDADRLCAPYLREAGLPTAAPAYDGWESDGLGGHIGGHYLSACSQLYAASGDLRLRERLEHVLTVFQRCQDAGGDGYLGGVPGGRTLGEELAAGKVDADLFTLNGRWVPLYNLHKTLAGLLDAHGFAGSSRALAMASALADWWLGVSASLTDDLFEAILRTEFGGMNDAFAILAELTGKEEYLREASRFSHKAILDPLADGRDELDGLHANTQIPKVVGYARLARRTGDARLERAAELFWNTVTTHRTVSIGGNSVREHFHPSRDFSPMVLDAQGPETCNTYNMLKLAKLRFEATGDALALDYYERASYNHILSSQHPARGGFVYFTPMRPAHYRVYSKAQESMWCCVGSGLENHARYGELIYSYGTGDGGGLNGSAELSVNLYVASELDWADRRLRVRLDADLANSDVVAIRLTAESPTELTLRLRHPGWAVRMEVDVDGLPAAAQVTDGYVTLHRIWAGDALVTIRLAAEFRAEALPDGSPWVSFLYGPIVLAARAGTGGVADFEAPDERMGHVASGPLIPLAETPVVVGTDPLAAVVLRSRAPLSAELSAAKGEAVQAITLEPFAGIHDERYTVYWPTGESASGRSAELLSLDHHAAADGSVIDAVSAGEQQPESDHGFTGEATRAGGRDGLHWRSATGWFSYTLSDPDRRATLLRVRFRAVEGRAHQRRLNGEVLAEPVRSERMHTERDGDHELMDFAVPEEAHAVPGGSLTFSIHALPGSSTGDLLSVQLLGSA